MALGSDGSIIICTESGHVFVRSRNTKSGQNTAAKAFKFHRVPYLQRVTQVCANITGAFGALRVDFTPKAIPLHGQTLGQDLAEIQPYLRLPPIPDQPESKSALVDWVTNDSLNTRSKSPTFEPDEEGEVILIRKDVVGLMRLCEVLVREKQSRQGAHGRSMFEEIHLSHGADVMVQVQSTIQFPAHRVVLAARSVVLHEVLSRSKVVQDQESNISIRFLHAKHPTTTAPPFPRLAFAGCQAISVLILLTFLYSDELMAIWDPRVAVGLEQQLRDAKIKPALIKLELQAFARLLDLPHLATSLASPAKHAPAPSIVRDMDHLFTEAQIGTGFPASGRSPVAPDVILMLGDREVSCHSVVLRARSVFFASFFDDREWTIKRWESNGTIKVDMKHLNWRVMDFVLRFIYCGGAENMFATLGTFLIFFARGG